MKNASIFLPALGLGGSLVLLAACGNDSKGYVHDTWHVGPKIVTTAYCPVAASTFLGPGPSGGGSRSGSSSSSRTSGSKASGSGKSLFGGSKVKTKSGPNGVKIRKDSKGRLVGRNGKPCPRVAYTYSTTPDEYRLLLADGDDRPEWKTVSRQEYERCHYMLYFPRCAEDG